MSSSGAEIGGKKVTLRSVDNKLFEVEEGVALMFQVIKHMVDDDYAGDVIPLPNSYVTGKILSKIIDYCKKHVDAASAIANYEVSVNNVDRQFLLKIIKYVNPDFDDDCDEDCDEDGDEDSDEHPITEFLLKIIEDCERHVDAAFVNGGDREFLLKIIKYGKEHPTGDDLWKIIEACEKHVNARSTIDDDLEAFDANFVKVHVATLVNLSVAANYLDIKSLLVLTTGTVADVIKGKTPFEIREIFGISQNFTPEQEEEVRRENAWAFK